MIRLGIQTPRKKQKKEGRFSTWKRLTKRSVISKM